MIVEIPRLVHHCHLVNNYAEGDVLIYHDMGSDEYDCGGQSESLRRIFLAGFCKRIITVYINKQHFCVYLVASEKFSFNDYQQYLQLIIDGGLPLEKAVGFSDAVKDLLNLRISSQCYDGTDVWFDFKNDVFLDSL